MTSNEYRAYSPVAGGTSTLSKSSRLFPANAPRHLVRAEGSWVWDADGNKYVDFIAGLLSVTIGHNDHRVNNAVRDHLDTGGPTWSLPHPLEEEVAETILRLTGFEGGQVRFFKSGSEACTAALRIARAVTRRPISVNSGYHGWHDPLLATPPAWGRAPGSMNAVRSVPFNDEGAVERCFYGMDPGEEWVNREDTSCHADQIAAVFIEPETVEAPKPGYLERLRELCTRYGSLLIFDECITGARYPEFTAARHFGVTPDLIVLSKGLANGWPLACVVGPREIMRCFDVDWAPDYAPPNIRGPVYASGTWATETSGLAAAKATLDIWERDYVVGSIEVMGTLAQECLAEAVAEYGLQDLIRVRGPYYRTLLDTPDLRVKTLFLREMMNGGILMGTGANMMAAHDVSDVRKLEDAAHRAGFRVQTKIQLDELDDVADVVISPYRQA